MNLTCRTIKSSGYNIHIGNQALNILLAHLKQGGFSYDNTFIIVDENTKKYCLPLVLKAGVKANILEIKSGEKHKTLDTAKKLWSDLLSGNAVRNSVIINLGGGVICDLGGFVASAFKRGIQYINVPTTLLAQADASIGGKTGIDFDAYKNQIGFFSNPQAVFINPEFLNTLPQTQLLSGFAEIIKHALIADEKLWNYLKLTKSPNQLISNLANQQISKSVNQLISKSVIIKNRIVMSDPFEQNIRKKLNFGHTIGHAIESLSLLKVQSPLLHGEAIAMGIICESYLSFLKTGLKENELQSITSFILSFYPKYKINKKDIGSLIEIMQKDKKNKSNSINFTLLNKIGNSIIDQTSTIDEINNSLEYFISA